MSTDAPPEQPASDRLDTPTAQPSGLFGSPRSTTILVGAVILSVGVFFLSTVRAGHNWGDDFAMYIMHARNIEQGHAYAPTGYIYNPAVPGFGPRVYPPVFPLFLAPLIAVWGFHFTPMKVEVVLFFLAALLCCYALFRRELNRVALLMLIGVLGFNPFLWAFKDQVLSDIPFLFFVVLAVYAIHSYARPDRRPKGWRAGVIIGALSWLAFGTRTVGIVLLPVALIADWFAVRKWTRQAVYTIATFAGLVLAQRLVFGGGEASYLDQLKPTLESIKVNLHLIPREIVALWGNGHFHALVIAGSWIVVGLAAIGFIARLGRRVTVLEIFPVVYMAAVVIWPSPHQGSRLLIPVIPFLMFFVLVGIQTLALKARRVPAVVVASLLIAIALASYSSAYASADYGPIRDGVGSPEAIRFFHFIDTNTPRDAVFIFRRPRALALFTDRSASVYEPAADVSQNWRYFQQIHAEYLALAPEDRGGVVVARVVATHRADLVEIYQADSFRIYRIVGRPGT